MVLILQFNLALFNKDIKYINKVGNFHKKLLGRSLVVIVIIVVIAKCKVKQLLALLTYDWFLVATFNVVPFDAILERTNENS